MQPKDETTSFVIRFTQKVFNDEGGEAQVQWRGHIRHVQTGTEQRFGDFGKAIEFIQGKLADLTLQAMEDKPVEEQKSILSKSFNLWKKMAVEYPKMVIDNIIKDPKSGIEQLQNQVSQIGETLGQSIELEIDEWRGVSKSDYKHLLEVVNDIAASVNDLTATVSEIAKKKG